MILETLLLVPHLLCVNLASGGPIVGAWLDWRGSRGDEMATKAARRLAAVSLFGLLAGAGLGLLLGWLKWTPDYAALWGGPMNYKLKWAVIEALFSLLLMLGWWFWLPRQASGRIWAVWTRVLMALLAATNLLYHFPILFYVAAHQYDAGQTAGPVIRGGEFRRLMLESQALALWMHVVLASIAVAGIFLVALSMYWQKSEEAAATAKLARWGGRWALLPSLAQLPIGLWTLTALPTEVQSEIMGHSTAGTLLLVASLLAALWLVNELVYISMGEAAPAVLRRAIIAMLITVSLMTALQQQARSVVQLPNSSGQGNSP
jgi:hypothetical protein